MFQFTRLANMYTVPMPPYRKAPKREFSYVTKVTQFQDEATEDVAFDSCARALDDATTGIRGAVRAINLVCEDLRSRGTLPERKQVEKLIKKLGGIMLQLSFDHIDACLRKMGKQNTARDEEFKKLKELNNALSAEILEQEELLMGSIRKPWIRTKIEDLQYEVSVHIREIIALEEEKTKQKRRIIMLESEKASLKTEASTLRKQLRDKTEANETLRKEVDVWRSDKVADKVALNAALKSAGTKPGPLVKSNPSSDGKIDQDKLAAHHSPSSRDSESTHDTISSDSKDTMSRTPEMKTQKPQIAHDKRAQVPNQPSSSFRNNSSTPEHRRSSSNCKARESRSQLPAWR